MILPLLIAFPGCGGNSGDFCALYERVLFEPELAREIVERDRPAAEAVAVNEATYQRCE
jgi:hypothetical protein